VAETEQPAQVLHPLRPRPNLVVSIRADGLEIETPLHSPTVRVRWPELVLLNEIERLPAPLARGAVNRTAEITGADPEELLQFTQRLQYWHGLASIERPIELPVSDRPEVCEAQPVALDGGPLALMTPMMFRPHGGRYELYGHGGYVALALTPTELQALSCLLEHPEPAEALDTHRSIVGDAHALDADAFAQLLGRVEAEGWLRPHPGYDDREDPAVKAVERQMISKQVFARQAAAQDAAERELEARTGRRRPKVIPVAFDIGAPGGIGMVFACAKAWDGGRLDEFYDFRLDWIWNEDRMANYTAHPAVYLFSNYL
jgi:hypothetical protein